MVWGVGGNGLEDIVDGHPRFELGVGGDVIGVGVRLRRECGKAFTRTRVELVQYEEKGQRRTKKRS